MLRSLKPGGSGGGGGGGGRGEARGSNWQIRLLQIWCGIKMEGNQLHTHR